MKRPSTKQGFTLGSDKPKEGFVSAAGRHRRVEKPGRATPLPDSKRDEHWENRGK